MADAAGVGVRSVIVASGGTPMSEWIVCQACKLKHSARPDGVCPRCREPVAPALAAPGGTAEAGVAPADPGTPPARPAVQWDLRRVGRWFVDPGAQRSTAAVRVAGAGLLVMGATNLAGVAAGFEPDQVPRSMLAGSAAADLAIGFFFAIGRGGTGLVTLALLRASLGAAVAVPLLLAGDWKSAAFQALYLAGLVLLLLGRAGTARLAAGAVALGIVACLHLIGLGAVLAKGSRPARRPAVAVPARAAVPPPPRRESLGDAAERLSGSSPTWSVDLPGGHWRIVRLHPQQRDADGIDAAVAWPDKGARIAVIATPVGRRASLGDATQEAIHRARRTVASYEEISRLPLGATLDGNLVRGSGRRGDEEVGLLTAVFVYADATIELQGTCPVESLDDVYDEFRAVLDSLRR